MIYADCALLGGALQDSMAGGIGLGFGQFCVVPLAIFLYYGLILSMHFFYIVDLRGVYRCSKLQCRCH